MLENDRWSTGAGTVEVQPIATYIDQLAGWMKLCGVLPAGAVFVTRPDNCNDYERHSFDCKHDTESSRTTPSEFLIPSQARNKQCQPQNKRHRNAQQHCPTHGMQTGCDLSLREAGTKKNWVIVKFGN